MKRPPCAAALKRHLINLNIENNHIRNILIITAAVYCVKIVSTFVLIPFTYDSTWYHLPNLIDYLQHGRIFFSEKPIYSNCYPRNIEMLYLWQMVFVRNGMTLGLVQLFLALFGALSIYGILRSESVKHEFALLGGALYLSTPVILAQITSQYVDTPLASIFFGCMYFLNSYIRGGGRSDTACLCMLLGVLLGIKYSCVAYFGIFVFFFFLAQWKRRERILARFRTGMTLLLCAALTGGIWYALNYYNFRNPLYPFGISLFGEPIFHGLDVDAAIMSDNTSLLLSKFSGIAKTLVSWAGIGANASHAVSLKNAIIDTLAIKHDQRVGGFGFQWIFILLPAFLLLGIRFIRSRRISFNELSLIAVPLVSFLITPANWWTRYICFILFLGIYGIAKNRTLILRYPVVLKCLTLFVVLSCVQGSLRDAAQYRHTLRNLAGHGFSIPFRSILSQMADPEYAAFIQTINDRRESYDIVLLQPMANRDFIYYFAGDTAQNRVRVLPYRNIRNANPVIGSYEEFEGSLQGRAFDRVLVPPVYTAFIRRYTAAHPGMTLVHRFPDGTEAYSGGGPAAEGQ